GWSRCCTASPNRRPAAIPPASPPLHIFAPGAGAPTVGRRGCSCVGAPPRCEPGGHAFAPAAGAPTIRGRVCFCVGAPPRCEPRGHPSPVIGASYGGHCSKSPAGRVQSGFQSPSPRGRKLMSERGVLLVNLGSPSSTEVADVRRYLNQFLMD